MFDSKNKIGDIKQSNIGSVNQQNVENQNNIIVVNNVTNINVSLEKNKYDEIKYSHYLSPYFKVEPKKLNDGKYGFVSKPAREDSLEKYPINFKGSLNITDERFKDLRDKNKILEMLQFADSPIEVKVTDFKQYLGDVIDPYPNPDFSPMRDGVKTYILPKKRELPKVEIKIDIGFDNTKFKLRDINLKLTKQLASNKFVLDNYNQLSYPVFIQLILEFVTDEEIKCSYHFDINKEKLNDCRAVYIYNKFILNIITGTFYMYNNGDGKIIMSGIDNNKHTEESIKELKGYINFLKAIIEIEKYFNIRFDLPEKITDEDEEIIKELSVKIRESKKKLSCTDLKISFIKKDVDLEKLKHLIKLEEAFILNTYENISLDLFDKNIKIKKIIERFNYLKCQNVSEVEKFIQNYNMLDDDYKLNIIMIPSRGKRFYKYTKIKK